MFTLECLFQSTLPRGERQAVFHPSQPYIPFQSTLPRGERRRICTTMRRWMIFQSTLPRGERRKEFRMNIATIIISIHAPAWGATNYIWWQVRRNKAFQSTLPRGERRLVTGAVGGFFAISIHAPAWGATAKINKASCSKINTRSDIAIPLPKSGENKPFSPLFFYFDPHSRREGSGKILDTSPSRRITFIPGRVHPIKQ